MAGRPRTAAHEGLGTPLSERIRTLRKQCGMSQTALAIRAGVYRLTVTNSEIGKSTPDLDTLRKLAAALGVKVEELL